MRLIINNILQNRQFDSYRNYPLFYAYRLLGAVPSNVHSERTSIIYATPCVLGVSNPHGNHFDGMAVAPMSQSSSSFLTQSGTGTVRTWPPLPTKSTMAQCSSRCWR